MDRSQTAGGARSHRLLGDPVLLALLALGAALRVAFACRKGWVLDEFHTDYHAQRATLELLFQGLLQDNHPPLSFLLVRVAGAVLGTSDLALRAPALLCGALEPLLAAALARPFGRRASRFAAALVVTSSLHLDFASQVRMYAPFSLAVTAATLGLRRRLRGAGGAWLLGLGAWCAVHLHYHAAWFLAALTLAGLAGAARQPSPGRCACRILIPLLLAASASLPWVLLGLLPQLRHGLPPGGDDLGLPALGEAVLHLLALNIRLGGPAGRAVFALAALCVVLVAAAGLLLRLRARGPARDSGLREEALLLAAMGFLPPLLAFVAARLHPRAGFTWHYLLPALPAVAALAGSLADRRSVRLLLTSAATALFVLCGLNLAGRGTEDFRGAAEWIRGEAQPGDAVVCVEYQPPVFPTGRPWDRYGAGPGAPPRLATTGIHLDDPAGRLEHPRLWLMSSALPRSVDLVQQLEASHTRVQSRSFGWRPVVELWVRREGR